MATKPSDDHGSCGVFKTAEAPGFNADRLTVSDDD